MYTSVSGTKDKIEAMASVMIETFGERALPLALAQVDAAIPDQPAVAETWSQIVDSIRDRFVPSPGSPDAC